jgi:hypothetical protein
MTPIRQRMPEDIAGPGSLSFVPAAGPSFRNIDGNRLSKSQLPGMESRRVQCDENQTKDVKLLRLAQDRRVPAGISTGGGLTFSGCDADFPLCISVRAIYQDCSHS